MSRAKTERLLNLTIALLDSHRALSREQIRLAVPGYPEAGAAFERMFERDKDELREMGIPVSLVATDAWFDDEVGYRIDRDAYAVPEVSFTPEELAVLALAARAWTQASLGAPAARGLLKLRAYEAADDGDGATDRLLRGLEPRLDVGGPAFLPLWRAVRDRSVVAFDYRRADGSAAHRRQVSPWGLVSRHGHWYLVGYDHERDAERAFRVSRIVSDVRAVRSVAPVAAPPDVDLRSLVTTRPAQPAVPVRARVALTGGSGGWLRSQAEQIEPDQHGVQVVLLVDDIEELADHVAGLGRSAVALEPPELRVAVIARLQGVLRAADSSGGNP